MMLTQQSNFAFLIGPRGTILSIQGGYSIKSNEGDWSQEMRYGAELQLSQAALLPRYSVKVVFDISASVYYLSLRRGEYDRTAQLIKNGDIITTPLQGWHNGSRL